MSHIRVTLDGEQMMDEELGHWSARPPEFLKNMVTPPGAPKPQTHILAIGMVISTAVLSGEDAAIDVTTHEDGWSMSVSKSLTIALPAG